MRKKETTTSYSWPAENIIQRIDVREQSNGFAVAYIYANPDPDLKDDRLNIRAAIRHKGWGTLSDHRNNEFGLRVSGLKNGTELIEYLAANGYISTTNVATSVHTEKNDSKGGWFKDNILRTSAVTYMLGNILYYKGADNIWDKGMAVAFAAGDGLLGIFGGRNDARQYTSLLKKFKSHLQTEGIEIPATASIHVETSNAKKSGKDRFFDWMHEYVNPMKIGAEVLGGSLVLKSGLTRDAAGSRNTSKIVSGIIIMAGWAGALLVKERKPDPDAQKDTSITGQLGSYIQEKPLRLAGGAGLTFNALKVMDAVVHKRSTSPWNLSAVGAMTAANAMYATANKAPGGDIKTQEMVSDAYTVAAQIINKQPEELREKAIESTAKFFGERTEIPEDRIAATDRLRKEAEIQRQNPWFEPLGLAAYVPKPKAHKILKSEENALAHPSREASASSENPAFASAPEAPSPVVTQATLAQRAASAPEARTASVA